MEALFFVGVSKKPVKFRCFLCDTLRHFVAVLGQLVVQGGHRTRLQIHAHTRHGGKRWDQADCVSVLPTTLWCLYWGRSSWSLTSSLCWLWIILSESRVPGIIPAMVEVWLLTTSTLSHLIHTQWHRGVQVGVEVIFHPGCVNTTNGLELNIAVINISVRCYVVLLINKHRYLFFSC